MRLYFDTNLVLQCRDFDQIDWSTLGYDNLTLVVPITTLEELDTHKARGNARTAARARRFISKYQDLFLRRVRSVRVTPARKHPTLEVAKLRTIATELPLDPTKADNRTIGEVLAALADGESAALLTADMAMITKADACGCGVVVAPENWALPPEKDELQKDNEKLTQQLKALLSAKPRIQVSVLGTSEDVAIKELFLSAYATSAVSDGQIAKLIEAARKRWASTAVMIGGSRTAFVDTWDKQWQEKLTQAARDLHLAFAYEYCCQPIRIRIENSGGEPARSLRVRLKTTQGFTAAESEASRSRPFRFPYPRLDNGSAWKPTQVTASYMLERRLDPMRLVNDLEGCDAELEPGEDFIDVCFDNFRHHNSVTFSASIAVLPDDFKESGLLEVIATMDNHPDRVVLQIPIRAKRTFILLSDAATQLDVDEDFSELLGQVL